MSPICRGRPVGRYHKSQAYVIDVSQSVEHDHPHALDFLRKDCTNITEFFRRKNVLTMSMRELFNFITDLNLKDDGVDAFLEAVRAPAPLRRRWRGPAVLTHCLP